MNRVVDNGSFLGYVRNQIFGLPTPRATLQLVGKLILHRAKGAYGVFLKRGPRLGVDSIHEAE